MKTKTIILFFVALINFAMVITSSSARSLPFSDVSTSYAQSQINKLYSEGIIEGDGNGKFHPKKPVTRAEFVTMLSRTLGIRPLQSSLPAYQDVAKNSWAYGWIQATTELGIVQGTRQMTFRPNTYITRQEAAVMLVRALKKAPLNDTNSPFHDKHLIASWATPYVSRAVQLGIMIGNEGNFRPASNVTRQEIAVVLERILGKKVIKQGSSKEKINLGWHYSGNTPQFIQRSKDAAILNVISPRWYFLESSGKLSDHTDAAIVTWAHQNGKKAWAMAGNRFNKEATHKYLSDSGSRNAIINQLVGYAKKYQLDGINLDFENIDPKDRDFFSVFVRDLASQLHAIKVSLSVSVPPNLGSEWSDPYDYKSLGKNADFLVLMAYDEHWNGSPIAGSVASLPWVQSGVKKLNTDVQADKIIVGFPLYTRDWFTSGGKVVSKELTIRETNDLLNKMKTTFIWNPTLGQYEATYTKNGINHRIWVEDSRSLALKYQMSMRLGTAGIAVWYIGAESPDVWNSLENVRKYESIGN